MVTKLQRRKHIANVLSTLAQNENFEEDRWGNLVSIDGTVRYKSKKTVLRKERKLSMGWSASWSAYFKDIEVIDEGKLKILKTI